MDNLQTWILAELDRRGWVQAELARRAHVTPSHISRLLSGETKLGLELVVGLSRALETPTDEVLRLAGILPPKPPGGGFRPRRIVYEGHTADRLLELWGLLAPEDQQRVLDLAERLAPPLPEPRIIGDPPADGAAE